jgi:methylmalonyl-CoA/ethylmalonyl-CoA epimerase
MTRPLLLAVHHVGVVTPDVEACAALYRALGYQTSPTFHDPLQRAAIVLCTRTGQDGGLLREPLVELIAPEDASSPAAGWLKRIRAGAYHTCYEVADLTADVEPLRELDFVALTKPVPAVAFGGLRVVFLWSALTGLVELVETGGAGGFGGSPPIEIGT